MTAPLDGGAEHRPPAGMVGSLGPLFRLVKDQRIAFLIVGAINTVVGTGWFVLFELLLGPTFGYMVSLLCAHVAAVLCAFVLYRRFVFRVTGHLWLDLARFELVNLTSLGINAVCLPLLVEVGHLAPIPAQLLITLVTMLVSFFGHRGFSFRRSPARGDAPAVPSDPGATR
ncbi:GtrA family protein [Cellulomonas cellasea]|uniref:Putative flippase GtrA n=1 Tax=Cellulomonas cellasea TaxID=43670 RepID=A0A7W4UET7_9CELL|nr:GtrA family protein [Cellulomonas cellasea]MBB2922890.1 putative flippase GtrA [Cellulomonas cellasea]